MKNVKLKRKSKNGLPAKVKIRNRARRVKRVPLRMVDENGQIITKGVFVDLKSDFGIKRIFGYPECKDELTHMTNAFFEGKIQPINEITYLNTEVLGNTKKQRKTLFDFYFKDEQNRHYELEMQNQPVDYMMRRSFSYTCRYHSEAMRPGKDFKFDQPPIIGIVIANFDIPELVGNSCISFHKIIDTSSNEVTTDATLMITIQLSKFNKKIDELIDEKDVFLFLLANMEKFDKIPPQFDNDVYRPIFERARFANFNDNEMREFNAAYKKNLTQRMEIEYSRNQGKLEGKLEGKLAIAEKLLAQNIISAKKIAEISELPLSQIIAIKHSVAQA